MVKQCALILIFLFSSTAIADPALLDHVNTLQGTDSSIGFSHGGTLPLVGAPWPMLQWSPQTFSSDWFEGGGWWFQSSAPAINGFRATRQPSPWMGDYGEFSIMPTTGELLLERDKRESPYDRDASVFKPDYCRIDLKRYDIRAELTAAERCAVMRFTYNAGSTGRFILDVARDKQLGHVEIDGRTIRGYSTSNNGGVPKGWKAFFVIHLDRDPTTVGTFANRGRHASIKPGDKSIDSAERGGMYVEFPITDQKSIELSIGTSYISYEQAELNLKRETDGGFEATRARTAKAWETNLSRLQIKGGSDEERRTFYSCLYRAQTFPHKLYELDANSQPIHYNFYGDGVGTKPGFLYGDNGFWDVYRTNYPFWSLVYPDQLGEILNGFVQAYRDGGWFPQWPSPGHRYGMIGSHIDAVIADAVVKKVGGFDVNDAYAGIRKDAFDTPPGGSVGRSDLKQYQQLGYVAGKGGYAVSRSLDYAYDDWCVAQVANVLGKNADRDVLLKRSQNYRKLFDPSVGFFRAKKSDGSWDGDFDEFAWGDPFVEGGPWQCGFAVAHDPKGLAELYGGEKQLGEKLDRLLGLPPLARPGAYHQTIHEMIEMAACRAGQYAQSNQPSHHILYLFAAIGEPWKTQYWTRRVCRDLYSSGPDGFIGDEDNGEMSSWYLLSAMGVYPLCVGDPNYTLTSPVFDEVRIDIGDGKPFTITSSGNSALNVYVRQRELNGKPFTAEQLSHETIRAGGTLSVQMGSNPPSAETNRHGSN